MDQVTAASYGSQQAPDSMDHRAPSLGLGQDIIDPGVPRVLQQLWGRMQSKTGGYEPAVRFHYLWLGALARR